MKRVWILSFECAGLVKVGGLGEAVYNIAEHLTDRGLEVTVFMPGHGVTEKPNIRQKLLLQGSLKPAEGRIRGRSFMPYRFPFSYEIGIQTGRLGPFKVVLFHGLNCATKGILDNETVYKSSLIEDKSLLLARGLKGYIEQSQDIDLEPPDVLHAHDYHSVPAAVTAKQELEERGHKVALVFTVHLLSGKMCSWNYLSENWCGTKSTPHQVYVEGRKVEMTHKAVLKMARSKLESFCALESHVLASVSQTYLQDEVVKQIGRGCEEKTAFHWNGCDWDYAKMLDEAMKKFGADVRNKLGIDRIGRNQLRKFFLTKAIGNLEQGEPFLEEETIRKTVSSFKGRPFTGGGRLEPFDEDGPMVLMTGRLAKQKGVDMLFRAMPYVLEKIPKTKFVLLMLPLEDEINLVKQSARLMLRHPESLRIILGKAPSIYSLAHLSSDIFVCPSKWEPFGIMALEAMATGNPVVSTAVGGLKEIVIDTNRDIENGTGILVPKNDHRSLGEALSSLLAIMSISELSTETRAERKTVQEISMCISNNALKEVVLRRPAYGSGLRENAMRRVETTFRWSKTIDMVINAYEKAISLAGSSR